MRDTIRPNSKGPNRGPNSKAESNVRRSRRFSKNSLAKTVSSVRISAHAFRAAEHLQKRFFQGRSAAACANLLDRGVRQDAAVADDDDAIAQRSDLLHH